MCFFFCTGNYFRSRFAEILFNHVAHEANLNWQAEMVSSPTRRSGKSSGMCVCVGGN
jgi:protein-tyrosine phosphatase